MIAQEHNGILTYKDKDGGIHQLFPKTKRECLLGMEEIDAHLADTNNPHKVTWDQTGAVPLTRVINGKELSKDFDFSPEDLGIKLDTKFNTEGAYAESKAVGDAVAAINKRVDDVSDTASTGLLLAKDKVYMTTETVTLDANAWSEKQQIIELDSVTADNTVIVGSHPDNNTMYAAMGVYCSGQGEGTITFTCFETPEENLRVNVIILE